MRDQDLKYVLLSPDTKEATVAPGLIKKSSFQSYFSGVHLQVVAVLVSLLGLRYHSYSCRHALAQTIEHIVIPLDDLAKHLRQIQLSSRSHP